MTRSAKARCYLSTATFRPDRVEDALAIVRDADQAITIVGDRGLTGTLMTPAAEGAGQGSTRPILPLDPEKRWLCHGQGQACALTGSTNQGAQFAQAVCRLSVAHTVLHNLKTKTI